METPHGPIRLPQVPQPGEVSPTTPAAHRCPAGKCWRAVLSYHGTELCKRTQRRLHCSVAKGGRSSVDIKPMAKGHSSPDIRARTVIPLKHTLVAQGAIWSQLLVWAQPTELLQKTHWQSLPTQKVREAGSEAQEINTLPPRHNLSPGDRGGNQPSGCTLRPQHALSASGFS